MRLNPGITLERADRTLRDAETAWTNAGSGGDFYRDYHDAVDKTYRQLRECYAEPDLARSLRSTSYWQLLAVRRPDFSVMGVGQIDAAAVDYRNTILRANNEAFRREIIDRQRDLEQARTELNALIKLAARQGLPLIFDTNMLNHWYRPSEIKWTDVLRHWREAATVARIVIPLRVIDELDRQKYGDGQLAKRAGRAIRGLYEAFKAHPAGEPVPIRGDGSATLEVWVSGDDRDGDADLAILRCAADLDILHEGGARVVTGDLGMRLRAQHQNLQVRELPEEYRKLVTTADE